MDPMGDFELSDGRDAGDMQVFCEEAVRFHHLGSMRDYRTAKPATARDFINPNLIRHLNLNLNLNHLLSQRSGAAHSGINSWRRP